MTRYALLLALFLAPGISMAQSRQIATVDMERAVLGSAAGAAARSTITTTFEKEFAELHAKQVELVELRNRYTNLSATLSDKAKAELVREYGERQKDFDEAAKAIDKRLDEMRARLLEPIIQTAKRELDKVRAEGKYASIIEWEGLTPYNGRLPNDVTDDLIKRINASMKAGTEPKP